MRNPFKKKPTVKWTDPMDPRGDGTLRAGDPMYDTLMKGNTVIGNFDPHKGWDIKTVEKDASS